MVAVTKLIGLLDKPALVYWANRIGLNGQTLSDHRNKSSKKGTKKHNLVERYIKEGLEFEGFEKFNRCIEGHEVLGCEVEVKNKNLIGRIDLITKKNGVKYVLDMKSSEKIYLSTKIQLSTYKHMLGADKVGVIDLNTFKLTILEDINTSKYYEIIKRLYQVYILIKELGERL